MIAYTFNPRVSWTGARALATGVLLVTVLVTSVCGQEPRGSGRPTNDTMLLRKIKAPRSQMGNWPRGNHRYFPMAREEYENLIERIAEREKAPTDAIVRIENAVYEARLEGTDLVEGLATLQIQHDVSHPVELPLELCGIPIFHPRWKFEPSIPATVGFTQQQICAAVVERSGALQFDWSVRGTKDSLEVVNFPLRFPASPSSRLILDLPVQRIPVIDHGQVAGPFESQYVQDTTRRTPQQSPGGHAPAKWNRWHLALGGHSHVELRVLPEVVFQQRERLVLLREATKYDLSESGVAVSVELSLDIHYQPLREIVLDLDPGVQLTGAFIEDQRISWSVEHGEKNQRSRAVLQLQDALIGTGRVLRLEGIASSHLEEKLLLPTLRPRDMFWQEGIFGLVVTEPLTMVGFEAEGCHPVDHPPLDDQETKDRLQFQLYRQDARVAVTLKRRPTQIVVKQGTTIRIGKSSVTGKVVADCESQVGEMFEMFGRIPRAWIVDAVESTETNAIADWYIQNSFLPTDSQLLRIRLRRVLDPAHPLRIVVSGHRARILSDLGLDAMRFCRFEQVNEQGNWMEVQAEAPLVLKLSGELGLDRLDAQTLSMLPAELLSSEPGSLVFDVNEKANKLRINVGQPRPDFSASITAQASVFEERLSESYEIRCTPQNGYVNQLQVRFSEPRAGEPQWMLSEEMEGGLMTRRVNQTSIASEVAGETWLIELQRPRREPFSIRVFRSIEFSGETRISLLSVVNAGTQEARLLFRTDPDANLQIDQQGLHPAPQDAVVSGNFPPVRAVYRYDPTQVVIDSRRCNVTIRPQKNTGLLFDAWVRNCNLVTHLAIDGRAIHDLEYQLDNRGEQKIAVRVPAEVVIQRALVENKEVALDRWDRLEPLVLDLPANVPTPRITLEMVTFGESLGWWNELSAPNIELEFSILRRQWTVNLPAGYQVTAPGNQQDAVEWTWKTRLFGPLARATSTSVPLSRVASAQTGRLNLDQDPSAERQQIRTNVLTPLSYCNTRAAAAFGWVFLLITTALVWRLVRLDPIHWLFALGVATVIALLAPNSLVPMTGYLLPGTFVGGVFAVFVGKPGSHHLSPKPSDTPSSGGQTSLLGGMFLVCCLLTTFPGVARAAETVSPEIFKIFVPVDDQGDSKGPYYVPEPVYRTLHELGGSLDGIHPRWNIQEATYRAKLDWELPDRELAVVELKAFFKLETMSRKVTVGIPFQKKEVHLGENSARLDGRPVRPQWDEENKLVRLLIEEPGSYLLELSFRPAAPGSEMLHGWEVQIPKIPSATLDVELPPDAPLIDIPTARGRLQLAPDTGRVKAELGPVRKLAFLWYQGVGQGTIRGTPDVKELVWLKIRPGSVILDAKISYDVAESGIGAIEILADPRLRLLPMADDSPVQRVQIESDQSQSILFVLKPTIEDQVIINARFLMTDTSGIGNLLFPRVNTVGNVTRRLLAVSVDHELAYQLHGGENLARIAATEFMREWETEELLPQFVLIDSMEDDQEWTISVAPQERKTAAEQHVTVICHAEHAVLDHRVDVMKADRMLAQHQLSVPPGLELENVEINDSSGSVPVHWTLDENNRLNIVLSRPTRESHRLYLRARRRYESDNSLQLPAIQLLNSQLLALDLEVLRQPGIRVNVTDAENLDSVEGRPTETTAWKKFLKVASWKAKAPGAGVVLRVVADTPEIQSVQVSTMVPREGKWWMQLSLQLSVSQGIVDMIDFSLPAVCGNEITSDSSCETKIVDIPGTGRRRLSIKLSEPCTKECTFHLQIPLQFPPGQRIHVPHAIPFRDHQRTHYVVLPRQIEQQNIRWDKSWLQPARLPEWVLSEAPSETQSLSYRVTGEDPHAEIRPREGMAGDPQLRLVDIHVNMRNDNTFHGSVFFYLDPAGRDSCVLQLPDRTELVHVTVAELPARTDLLENQQVKIFLGLQRLPQRMEVVFEGKMVRSSSGGSTFQVAVPEMLEVPVQRTLWTVNGRNADAIQQTHGISAERQKLLRLRGMSELMDLTADVIAEEPIEDITRWYQVWARRYVKGQRMLTLQLAHHPPGFEVERVDLEVLQRKQLSMARHLGTESILEQLGSSNDEDLLGNQGFRTNNFEEEKVTRLTYQGGEGKIALSLVPLEARFEYQRYLKGFSLAVAIFFGIRWRHVWESFVKRWWFRWPFLSMFLMGIVWWLWLHPRWLGLLIILVSILYAIRIPLWLVSWLRPQRQVVLSRRV
ncbi:MAG: hypothetical protein CMJ81_15170 [Planctomycetaceae bacterium]|nr:hypothetical protein [Planctomycetaceae bacterium]MBP62077.1 hypothetical protein [Planctomycetaceae bacterium]